MGDTPHLSFDDFRKHGHDLVDWIADYLETVETRPVAAAVEPGSVRALMPDHAPEVGEPMDEILADLDRVVMPGITHWQHPGWFAYFPASSSPAAILGEMAAAGLAVQGMLWSTSPAATEVESTVLDWLVDLLGLPPAWRVDTGPGGGVLQMSASDSTHMSLVVARQQAVEAGADAGSLVAYGSSQAHSSVQKGARVAGFEHVRSVEVDHDFAMSPAALRSAVESDRAAGLQPVWVCSTIGTTATTAVDPVAGVASVAAEMGLWHHIDAAYAGSAMICPEMRHLQAGAELADSYTFNPHKWLLTNFDCSVFWVADRAKLIDTLGINAPYLADGASTTGEAIDYRDWQLPLGRRFRALKLWFVLRSYGAQGLRSHIRNHLEWAAQFAAKVEADDRLERVAPTPFALVTFRHRRGDEDTRRLASDINATGEFHVTSSIIDGRPFIRVSIGSTWTEARHVDALWRRIDACA